MADSEKQQGDTEVPLPSEKPSDTRDAMESAKTQPTPAEFAYVESDNFTSEVFKIEIGNIPKYFSFGECKKLMKNKLKLNPHKVKVISSIGKVYVTFKSEADKEAAMEKLNNYKYKGRSFYVKNAKPKVDAMATKRTDEIDDSQRDVKRAKMSDSETPTLSPAEIIRNSVTKWHNISYEEQLTKKSSEMKNFLFNCRTRLGRMDLDHEVFVWIMKNRAELEGMCCPLRPILPSPVTNRYRNKSEFTTGLNSEGLKTVGYRVGKYRDKTCTVEETSGIDILPEKMQAVADKFQEYIRTSKKDVYDPQNYEGHWRQLTVRTTLDGEVMAIVIVKEKKESDQLEEAEEKESLKKFFAANCSELVHSLLYQVVPTHRGSGQELMPPENIFGPGFITEKLLNLQFRISPEAFFQCNTLAAEVLYTQIAKMLQPNSDGESDNENLKNVVLFDVCCGTGTIGLTLASSVKHVVGVEMCVQAVNDAIRNAKLNNIENAEFHCAKAEDILPSLVKNYSNSENEIVVVVDPPRAGLHNKVIQCLRKCSHIQKIIYVSCNPNAIFNNVTDLCRPATKRIPGLPFLPLYAQPVDLFPQTPHCELIVYFKRTSGTKLEANSEIKSEPNPDTV